MAVTCANCGEELLGAVNRCWRCGQTVLSAPGSGEAPPVRQLPPEGFVGGVEVVAAEMIPPVGGVDVLGGSPPQRLESPQDRQRIKQIIQVVAVVSVVCGASALLLSGYWFVSLQFAAVGIAAGIVGVRSRWRQLAAVGLLLSLMAFFGSMGWFAYNVFSAWYGSSPLTPATATDAESTLPDSLE